MQLRRQELADLQRVLTESIFDMETLALQPPSERSNIRFRKAAHTASTTAKRLALDLSQRYAETRAEEEEAEAPRERVTALVTALERGLAPLCPDCGGAVEDPDRRAALGAENARQLDAFLASRD